MEDTNLIIGKINSGKTRGVLFKKVKKSIENNENLLIYNSRDEYYKTYSKILKENGYNVLLLNLKECNKSNGYNPLLLPYKLYTNGNKDKALELINSLAHKIFKSNVQSDPFWENMATSYFIALTLILFKEAKEEEINLGSIQILINKEEKIKDYLDKIDITDMIYQQASPIVFAPYETRSSIISVSKQKLNYYLYRENLVNILNNDELNLYNLTKKTAIFIIGDLSLNMLSNVLIEQLIQISRVKELNFTYILDNFDTLPKLDIIKELILDASYNKDKVYMSIHDLKELEAMYDKYTINKIQNIIEITKELELETIGNDNEYPSLKENKKAYFDITK